MAEYPKLSAEAEEHWVAIEKLPDFAPIVAAIISTFQNIEASLPRAFSKLTGIELGLSTIILSQFINFSNRIDLMERLATARLSTPMPDAETALVLVKALRQVATIRNKYAHSQFSIGACGFMVCKINMDDPYRKAETVYESLETVRAELDVFKEVSLAVRNASWDGKPKPTGLLSWLDKARTARRFATEANLKTAAKWLALPPESLRQ